MLQSGLLDTGEGHFIHYECHGSPAGAPALVLHGGPGSGLAARARTWFDLSHCFVVQFDQRGAGSSRPHASDPSHDFSTNTTAHLIADIERLRTHLNIERWLVLGGSWGSTLALAYAEAHPRQVTGLALFAVATTSAAEVDWITRGVGLFFPREFETFLGFLPEEERSGCLAAAYNGRLMDPDPAVHQPAAAAWCAWEQAIVAVTPGHTPHPRYADPAFSLGFARLVTHYWRHRGFLPEGALRDGLPRLAGIPAALIHGRLDFGSPLRTAYDLARHWPEAELTIVETAGHDARDSGMGGAIAAALSRMI